MDLPKVEQINLDEFNKELGVAKKLIDVLRSLVGGRNRYKTQPKGTNFAQVIQGTLRRDFIYLRTIYVLMTLRNPPEEIFIDPCVDLSRRVLEDFISVKYIILKNREEMSEKFMDFYAVEQRRDADFLIQAGVEVDSESVVEIETNYKKIIEKWKFDEDRRTWAGVNVEAMVFDLQKARVLNDKDTSMLIHLYQIGNYKNHFCPTDILRLNKEDSYKANNEAYLFHSLFIANRSITNIALMFEEEFDVSPEISKTLTEIFDSFKQGSKRISN